MISWKKAEGFLLFLKAIFFGETDLLASVGDFMVENVIFVREICI